MDGIGPASPVAAICPAVEPTGRTMRAAWLMLAALLSVASASYYDKGGGEGQNDAARFNELQYNCN